MASIPLLKTQAEEWSEVHDSTHHYRNSHILVEKKICTIVPSKMALILILYYFNFILFLISEIQKKSSEVDKFLLWALQIWKTQMRNYPHKKKHIKQLLICWVWPCLLSFPEPWLYEFHSHNCSLFSFILQLIPIHLHSYAVPLKLSFDVYNS